MTANDYETIRIALKTAYTKWAGRNPDAEWAVESLIRHMAMNLNYSDRQLDIADFVAKCGIKPPTTSKLQVTLVCEFYGIANPDGAKADDVIDALTEECSKFKSDYGSPTIFVAEAEFVQEKQS